MDEKIKKLKSDDGAREYSQDEVVSLLHREVSVKGDPWLTLEPHARRYTHLHSLIFNFLI
jgi:hypothetical protein